MRYRFLTSIAISLVLIGNAIGADNRQKIVLSESEKEFVLVEMRNYVSGIQQIFVALSNDDVAAIGDIAESNGMHGDSMADVPEGLIMKLPKEFKMLGMPTHMAFDKVAKLASEGGTAMQVQKMLGETMKNCVACHAAYTLVTE
jgi:hypothetical protein